MHLAAWSNMYQYRAYVEDVLQILHNLTK